jgi:beta-1,4-mannosyltransferase
LKGYAPVPPQLNVGSWPGPTSNIEYIRRFCESLSAVGILVFDVRHPWLIVGKKIDVLHVHWPEQVFWDVGHLLGIWRAILAVAGLCILKIRGVKIVWCVHNFHPHDATRRFLCFWRMYAYALSNLVDGFITLSPSTVPLARKYLAALDKKPGTFVWHPPYLVRTSSEDRTHWRQRHAMTPVHDVVAFVGSVKPYKGVEDLLSCFADIEDCNVRLVIAGQTAPKLRPVLEQAAKQDLRILLNLEWLTEAKLQETVVAADVIALPFREALHSGSIVLGISLGRPVITPTSPYANDLQAQVGKNWIITYEPPLSSKKLSCLLFEASRAKSAVRSGETPNLDFLSIYKSGSKLRGFYESLGP